MAERLMGWVSNTQEPKRLNRYELLLDDELRLTCKSATLPKINVEQVEVHRMHNLYKVAGSKVTYDDITLTFYDFVDNKAGRKLDDWHKQVYNINTSLMGFPAQYKKNITLLMYGPDHSVVESWLLVGAWPKNISRKDLAWDSNESQEVTLTMAVDEAKLILSSGV
jgi:hypothetical protein